MQIQFDMRAQPDEVFAPNAFAENIGKQYGAGTLVTVKVAEDGQSATLTLETDEV